MGSSNTFTLKLFDLDNLSVSCWLPTAQVTTTVQNQAVPALINHHLSRIKSLHAKRASEMIYMQKRLPIILLAGALAVAVVGAAASQKDSSLESAEDGKHQPAPEPYSFSYTAESDGGSSSHQESGDGTGRVEGFYTILGEDGRERRVDYVADENGYRAKISTNEVGTRSESSADAQYEARLPSGRQLEAAKISENEYLYLEESHAKERERHLSRIASHQSTVSDQSQPSSGMSVTTIGNNWQQSQQFSRTPSQGQQQQQTLNQQAAVASNQQAATQDQPQSLLPSSSPQNRNDGSYTIDPDADWRARSAALKAPPAAAFNSIENVRGMRSSSYTSEQSNSNVPSSDQWMPALSSNSRKSSFSIGTQRSPANASQEQSNFQQQQQLSQRLDNEQQVQAAAWQLAGRGGVPARKPTTILQRQLEQQFMQQAFQLTDQDYPRAVAISQQAANSFGKIQTGDNQAASKQQQQQQFVSATNQKQQQQEELSGINYDAPANQPHRPQTFQQEANQAVLQQQQQQQSNIVDEIIDDRLEQAIGNQGGFQASVTTTASDIKNDNIQFQFQSTRKPTATTSQDQAVSVEQEQAEVSVQRPVAPSSTTQTVPDGFVAINLNQESVYQQGQQPERPATTQATLQQQTSEAENTNTNQQNQQQQAVAVQQSQYAQKGQKQQQQQLETIPSRPNSMKQIIESYMRQRTEQNVKQAAPITTTTTTTTTTNTPESFFQPEVQTTPQPIETTSRSSLVLEAITTSRRPVYVQTTTLAPQIVYSRPDTTTLTLPVSTTTSRPLVLPPTSRAPVATYPSVATSRRPQQQQQQVVVTSDGVKGGSKLSTNFNGFTASRLRGPVNSQQSNSVVASNRPAVNTYPSSPAIPFSSPTSAPTTSTTTSRQSGQANSASQDPTLRPAYTSISGERPKTSNTNQVQTTEITNYQPQKSQVSTDLFNQAEIGVKRALQQQQQWKGIKGGALRNPSRRQFWQQPQQQASGISSRMTQQTYGRTQEALSSSSSKSNQSNVLTGVDYANIPTFGSRLVSG